MNSIAQQAAPLGLICQLIERSRHPMLIVGLALFVPIFAMSLISGGLYPVGIPPYEDPLEMTGVLLATCLLPPYISMCFIASIRIRMRAHATLGRLMDDGATHKEILNRGIRYWPVGCAFGLLATLLNANLPVGGYAFGEPAFYINSVHLFGQLLLWQIVGLALFFAVQEGIGLHRLGKIVPINLYKLDDLNGFGETALNSLLLIAGALALSMVQALDFEIRWVNYRSGLAVGIPAALILVPLPIWNVHHRIKRAKQKLLADIDKKIANASTELEGSAIEHLNGLLLRRDHVQRLRNWPMNISIAMRFMLYGFIVPMAWAGAALMEVLLDAVLGL